MQTLSVLRVLTGISGAGAVGAGAYGAHGMKNSGEVYREVFQTGNRYHMLHTVALLAVPACGASYPGVAGGLLLAGMGLFSGSCYVVGLKEDRAYGRLAPVGGMLLMAGWLAIAL
eukprot:Nk52_evm5s367 gene=Nk52_evmTU5s367